MNTIDPLAFQLTPPPEKGLPSQELGKNDFLNLLMVQLKNQDPLNVQDDKEFIAQMAQFSSLEQMTNLSSSLSGMLQFQQLSQGSALLGKTITAQIPNPNSDGDPTEITGVVTETRLIDGNMKLMVNDQAVEIEHILSVTQE